MRLLKKTCAVTVSAAMAVGLFMGNGSVSYAADKVEKEETVYVKLESDGTVKEITVSDWLKNVTGTGDVEDVSNLNDIKNVKGDETFEQGKDGKIIWKSDNKDIYYQGTSNQKLPVGIQVSYQLDGKDVKPSEIVGKSGALTMIIQYENHNTYEDQINGEKVKMNTPFLMASAIILPVDHFSEVKVSQGKLVSEGNNQILVIYGIPGFSDSLDLSGNLKDEMDKKLSDTITIEANVTDFSLGDIYTVATSEEFSDIELEDESGTVDVENAVNDLVEATGKMPTDAAKQIARLYDDNANTILDMWDAFQEDLSSYDEAVTSVKNYDESDYTAATDALNSIDENTSEDEAQEIIEEYENQEAKRLKIRNDIQTVGICETLKTYEYNDGTLLDFFLQPREEIEDDITVLYPLVASLTEGQLAGLDFISLKELTAIALTTDEGYSDASLDALKKISIYDGVDRSIYEKGGVALTSDALRADAEAMIAEENSKLGGWSIAMFVITGLAFVAFASCVTALITNVVKVKNIRSFLDREVIFFREAYGYKWGRGNILNLNPELKAPLREGLANTKLCKYLSIGAGVLMVVLAGVSVYLTYLDMVNYYKVEFTPQPHYIIDEKDLIGYNKKGEKIVLKNQYAYYKIVECNRNKSAEFYNVLGTGNDLNGDVGKQWLTLYVAKNDAEDPIIASSLKAVVGNDNIPTGYETGIHMFGSNSAYNLNNTKFVWNKSAKSVYVYFTRDENANASEASSIFSTGTIALSGGLGLALGAVLGAVAMTAKNKKKENQTLATD